MVVRKKKIIDNFKIKNIIFIFATITFSLIILFIVCEFFFKVYYLITDKGYMSVSEKLLQEKNVYIRNIIEKKDDCDYLDSLFPHPYLGFVHHGNEPCGFDDINNIGLFGPDYPLEKYDDKYVIMVTGGSVAGFFAQIYKDGPKYLQDILNEQYMNSEKKFLILNGGVGAWQSPQQLILFLLYAEVVDAVITIDGFNEYLGMKSISGVRLEYSNIQYFLGVNPTIKHSYKKLLGGFLRSKIFNISKNNWFLSHSHFAYYLTNSFREIVANFEKQEVFDNSRTTIQSMFTLPSDWNEEKRFSWSIGQYKKYIRMINYIAKGMNIKTAHFIQPVPAIHKPLTSEEKKRVGDLSYGKAYSKMTDELLKLQVEGFPIFSLLDVFKNTTEHIYGDRFHCKNSPSGESQGYKIMAKRIAEVIGKTWGLERKQPATNQTKASCIKTSVTKIFN